MTRFTINFDGQFSLQAVAAFFAHFPPITTWHFSHEKLELVFLQDETYRPVHVSLHESQGSLVGDVSEGADVKLVKSQVQRFLYLNYCEADFRKAIAEDDVMVQLQQTAPYPRPICFFSPYEAAIWSVLSTRIRSQQAVQLQTHLAEQCGDSIPCGDKQIFALPSPEKLLMQKQISGISAEKLVRLHSVAQATIDNTLNPNYLQALAAPEALANLKNIHGIGDFYAELIYARAVAPADFLPTHEPRVRKAAAMLYGIQEPMTPVEFQILSEKWRPYRTWACFVLRTT